MCCGGAWWYGGGCCCGAGRWFRPPPPAARYHLENPVGSWRCSSVHPIMTPGSSQGNTDVCPYVPIRVPKNLGNMRGGGAESAGRIFVVERIHHHPASAGWKVSLFAHLQKKINFLQNNACNILRMRVKSARRKTQRGISSVGRAPQWH